MGFESDFLIRIVGLVESLVEVGLLEGVDIDDGNTRRFEEFHILLECCRVHRHEHVGEVTRSVNTLTNVNLETRHTAQSALWGANFGGIVGESGNLVSHACRNIRENVTGKLHSVA